MAQETKQTWSDLRVGMITFGAVVCLVLGITFAGGDKGLLFQKTSVVKARLADVGGLKKGGSVTMNGMVIGRVTNTAFVDGHETNEVAATNQIEVTMEIRSDLRKKIKKDSVPVVRTQGMLGDRYIDIPPGSATADVLGEEEILIGATAGDFDKTLKQALDVMSETQTMLKAVNDQKGTAGKLVYDEKFYNNLTTITDQMNELLKDFKQHPRRYIKFSLF